MSDEAQVVAASPPVDVFAYLDTRQKVEVEEGVEVQFYKDDEQTPENYLGSVWINNDPNGFDVKLERLKQAKGYGKSHVWGAIELKPLREQAMIGTIYKRITGWGGLESTEANILKVTAYNHVWRKCNNILNDEATWDAAAKAATSKNSAGS